MLHIARWITVYFILLLIYNNATAISTFDQSFVYDEIEKEFNNNEEINRSNRNDNDNGRKIDDFLDDQSIKNVHIQIFLVTPNKKLSNSEMRSNNDFINKKTDDNNMSLQGTEHNPIVVKIDLERAIVDEVSNIHQPSSVINDDREVAIMNDEDNMEKQLLQMIKGLNKEAQMSQMIKRSDTEAQRSQLRKQLDTEMQTSQMLKRLDREGQPSQMMEGLDTESQMSNEAQTSQMIKSSETKVQMSQMRKPTTKTFNSLLNQNLSQNNINLTNYIVNLKRTTMIPVANDNVRTSTQPIIAQNNETGKRLTESEESNKILSERIESANQLKLKNKNVAVKDRNWLVKNVGETSRAVRKSTKRLDDFPILSHTSQNQNPIKYRFGNLESSHIVDFSRFLTQSPSVEETDDKGILLQQTSDITTNRQQISAEKSSFDSETSYSGTSGIETVSFPSSSNIPENEMNFQEIMTTSTTSSTTTTVSNNISPDVPFKTTVSMPESRPKPVIFPSGQLSPVLNETREILSPERTLIENIIKSAILSGNRTFYSGSPVAQIVVGDREILEEQTRLSSSVVPSPHISIGERIDETAIEADYSDSVKNEDMIDRNQETINSLRREDKSISKGISPFPIFKIQSAGKTRLKEAVHFGFDSKDEIGLPDYLAVAIPNQSDHIQSIGLTRNLSLNVEAPFTKSVQQSRNPEMLKSASTLLPKLTEHVQFIQPRFPFTLNELQASNDQMNNSENSEQRKTKSDSSISEQLKLQLVRQNKNQVMISKNKIMINEAIDYCYTVTANEAECLIANDKSDEIKSDILFLIDASNKITKKNFQQELEFIMNTVEQFRNFDPDGVQISLIRLAREPVLEFSFRKHTCKLCVLADIADTVYKSDSKSADNNISAIVKYAFSKQRGNRNEVPKILILVSNGMSDGHFYDALKLINPNNITAIIVSMNNTNSYMIKQFNNDEQNQHFLNTTTTMDNDELIVNLVEFIRNTTKDKLKSFKRKTTMDEIVQEITAQCLNDGFNATFKLFKSFDGTIIIRGKNMMMTNCSKVIQAQEFGEHVVTYEINFFISFKQCGIEEIISINPPGKNYSALISVVHDKWLAIDADEGFILHCHQSQLLQEPEQLRTDLRHLQNGKKVMQILPLNAIPPLCNYTIRANAPNGPIIQSAKFGDTVYHSWECDSDHQIFDFYGLHIHHCFVENEANNQHMIIDKDGCSIDTNIVDDVVYSENKLMAIARVKVFQFINSKHLLFHCKLTLCIRKADGCEGITPPQCAGTGHHQDLLLYRRTDHNMKVFLNTLTSEKEVSLTVFRPENFTTVSIISRQNVDEFSNTNLFWLLIILISLSVIVLLLLGRYITKMHDEDDEYTTSKSLKRNEIIDRTIYIKSLSSSINTNSNFLSTEKNIGMRTDLYSYNGFQQKVQPVKDADRNMKTETVCVSLNSNEIKPAPKCDNLYSAVLATVCYDGEPDEDNGSSRSF